MAAPPLTQHTLEMAALHLKASTYFQIAGYTMLLYDHMITFDEEVNRVWKRKMSGASILFFLNRYATPIQFALIVMAFNNPGWSKEFCDRFAPFEGSSTIGLLAVCEAIMILRVFALYNRNYYVLGLLIFLWIGQITIGSYGLIDGFAVPLPPQLKGCIFTGPPPLFAAQWFGPLVTDTCILILTLYKTHSFLRARSNGSVPTVTLFARDGVMYFFVIFLANLLNILIYAFAVDDVKPIGASFSQLITSVMISRLVLNLRSVGEVGEELSQQTADYRETYPRPPRPPPQMKQSDDETFMTRTLGNLGGQMKSEFYDFEDQPWVTNPARTPSRFPMVSRDQSYEMSSR